MATSQRTRGFALVTALMFIVILSLLTSLVTLFVVNNLHHTRSNLQISRTLALAQGARNFGAALLQGPISQALGQEITYEAQAGTLGISGDWIFDPTNLTAPDPDTVATNLQTLAANLQQRLPSGGCYGPYTLSGGQQVLVRMTFTTSLPKCDGSGAVTTVKLGRGRFLNGGRNAQQTYALPYVMVASGINDDARRTLTLTGQYNFTVGNGSFARYALFTDTEQIANSGYNYFTGAYLFDGPVHTNGNFAFYGNKFKASVPCSGHVYFGGPVSSAGVNDAGPGLDSNGNPLGSKPGARFMPSNGGSTKFRSPSLLNPAVYKGTAPQFTQGVAWNSQYIPLPTDSISQKDKAQESGLYISGNVNLLALYAGDEFGLPLVSDGNGGWKALSGGDIYQYIAVCQNQSAQWQNWQNCTLYRYSEHKKVLQKLSSSLKWTDAGTSNFNGVIYVDGNIKRFTGPPRPNGAATAANTAPAIASFAQLDVVTNKDVRVTGDLKYQTPVCDGALRRGSNGNVIVPNCTNDPGSVKNVLGIYAAGDGGGKNSGICEFPNSNGNPGNICFGANNTGSSLNAPGNLEVDATLMANYKVDLENWKKAPCSGTLSIMGGVITNNDGVYGRFYSSNGKCANGVFPRFTYDPRFSNGLAPPFFPTVKLAQLMSAAQPIIYAQTEQTNY